MRPTTAQFDSPLAGVTVTLWTKLGQLATTTTDANGHYSFTAYPGHYNIQVATQPGYRFTPTGDSDVSDSGWSGFHELTANGTLTLDAGLGIPPAPAPPVTITKYYTFNGQPVAMRKVVDGQPDALYFLYTDHLGSTVLVTDRAGNQVETQQYYAYGRPRGGGTLPTDFTFTGQKVDGTGLMYYRARYYDPVIGQFISPDTIVPDAGSVLDYNRYLYVRGNPMGYKDDSGHIANWVIGAGVGAVAGAGLYLWNEFRNGDGFNWRDVGDWGDLGVAAGSGAVAGALIATPGMQAAGISMAGNIVGDHAANLLGGDDFSTATHLTEGVVGLVTPGIAGGTGKLVAKIPRIKQSGAIAKTVAELAGIGLMDGTISTTGKAFEQWVKGDGSLTSGQVVGEYVDGLISAPISRGTEKLGGYFASGVSETWRRTVTNGLDLEVTLVYENVVSMLSWNFEEYQE